MGNSSELWSALGAAMENSPELWSALGAVMENSSERWGALLWRTAPNCGVR